MREQITQENTANRSRGLQSRSTKIWLRAQANSRVFSTHRSLNIRDLVYSLPHLEADPQPQLNDPVGTGARAERGRGRIAQTSKIRFG